MKSDTFKKAHSLANKWSQSNVGTLTYRDLFADALNILHKSYFISVYDSSFILYAFQDDKLIKKTAFDGDLRGSFKPSDNICPILHEIDYSTAKWLNTAFIDTRFNLEQLVIFQDRNASFMESANCTASSTKSFSNIDYVNISTYLLNYG